VVQTAPQPAHSRRSSQEPDTPPGYEFDGLTLRRLDSTTTLRYEGDPAIASALAQMLREEGVEVEWERPYEARSLLTAMEAVAVFYFCKGSDLAIKLAVERFRRRFPTSKVSKQADDDED
jgi:hypothetical protein